MLTPPRPLRVLFLEPSAAVTGGAIALLRLVSALDRQRVRPLVVLGSAGPLVQEFRAVPGCRVLCRPIPATLAHVTRFDVFTGSVLNAPAAARYAAALHAVCARWCPDVIHSNGLKMHVLSMLLRRRNRALVWHMRDYVAPPYLPRRTAALIRALARLVPHAVICNSEITRAALLRPSARVPMTVHTIPDGVECPPLRERSRPARRERRVVLLGRIAEWKGQELFVDAACLLAATHAHTTFLIAGGATTAVDAEYEGRLRARVAQSGLSDRIRFAGVVRDVPKLLSDTDIVVHCSTSPEPFGQVVIEAMAAGVAVVAGRLGAPAAMIDDGVDGRLVPPHDADALARAIDELLTNEPLRARLGAAARATVRRQYGIDRTARRISALYHQCAALLPAATAS